ncbi:MAG: transketolase family protein [Oscillospiraceae bacterium]|jgi:transketolase|nr:transketolase family protein [Oscillospiraceae bacterium]
MEKEGCSSAFSKMILEEAKKDKNIMVVCTDSRGSAKLGTYPDELPEQFVEIGIAEQNAVTVSAGMSHIGKKVFVLGPASFYSTRSSEQVKVDLAYSHNNVTVIGISGGVSYGALGATHHSLQDIALMRAIPNLTVEIPSDATQMRAVTAELLKVGRPTYIRIGRSPVPTLYNNVEDIRIGKANKWFAGHDAAVIACGQLVGRALEAAKLLKKEGIEITVVDMHTIKPLDTDMIRDVAEKCGCILTLEEHSIYGGLGGAISEFVVQNVPVPMKICGIPDEDIPNGSDAEVFRYYQLDPEGIAEKVKALINEKG